jgi:hypothetical protein
MEAKEEDAREKKQNPKNPNQRAWQPCRRIRTNGNVGFGQTRWRIKSGNWVGVLSEYTPLDR